MSNTTTNTNNSTKGGMNMNIKEYANQIAMQITGAFVEEVEKANGVILTAVSFPTGSTNCRANFYINDLYNNGVDVEEAIDRAREVISKERDRQIDVDFVSDFEQVRPRLRARLYNKATRAEVYRSAAEFGFEDLIIIPFIEDINIGGGMGAIKVTDALVKTWGVSPAEVLRIAEDNARVFATLGSLTDVLRGMGYDLPILPDEPSMLIATNDRKCNGAYAVIAKLDELKKRFPNGFTVLPSSVHEVLIVDINDPAAMDAMVQEVNATEVDADEQLSNHAYTFAA